MEAVAASIAVLLLAGWLYLAADAFFPNFPTRLMRWWRGQPPP